MDLRARLGYALTIITLGKRYHGMSVLSMSLTTASQRLSMSEAWPCTALVQVYSLLARTTPYSSSTSTLRPSLWPMCSTRLTCCRRHHPSRSRNSNRRRRLPPSQLIPMPPPEPLRWASLRATRTTCHRSTASSAGRRRAARGPRWRSILMRPTPQARLLAAADIPWDFLQCQRVPTPDPGHPVSIPLRPSREALKTLTFPSDLLCPRLPRRTRSGTCTQ